MEVTHVREENKKLTKQMSDMRGKLADLEARVSKRSYNIIIEIQNTESDMRRTCPY
jgi:predicted  nucleic acid-binding Zn-ribbon protein